MSIENQVGFIHMPLGCVDNLIVNGEQRTIVIATTEETVIAAARHGAKCCRDFGGVTVAVAPEPMARAQIMYSRLPNPQAALSALSAARDDIANRAAQLFALRGSGSITVERPRFVPVARGTFLDTQVVLEVSFPSGEAMGAGMATRYATTLAEKVLHSIVPQRPTMIICDNTRLGVTVTASAAFRVRGGREKRDRLLDIAWFAECDLDIGRAATHNKGIMNAITGIGLATGQDIQAIEAAMHAAPDHYAPRSCFAPLTDDSVRGALTMRLPIGTVGGGTNQPYAAYNCRLMGIRDVADLAKLMAATGLVQNFAALRCLGDEGIPAAWERVRASKSRS